MRTKKLIKRFIFNDDNRARFTLGAGTRLNPATHRLQLAEDASGNYPLTLGLKAATWLAAPSSVKQWLGFEVVAKMKTVETAIVTSLGFRLSNGVNEMWWNGTAWVNNTVNWNTEAEVANNIGVFPVAARALKVIVNLVTTDASETPEVEMIKVLYKSDIEFQDDLVNRSLIPMLKAQLRPIADFPFVAAATGATLNLATTYKLETPYNIAGIDSVYNHTDDANHMTDLFQSYNAGTKVITLSSPVAAGKTVWVRFYYEPEVAFRTSQDYSEIEKVPSVILRDVALGKTTELSQDDTVINKATGAGTRVKAPLQGDLEITLQFLTDKTRDHQTLADEMKRFFGENQFITSRGMDEQYRLWLLDEYADQSTPSQGEVYTGRLRFRIADALFFNKAAVDVYAVKKFTATGDMDLVVE